MAINSSPNLWNFWKSDLKFELQLILDHLYRVFLSSDWSSCAIFWESKLFSYKINFCHVNLLTKSYQELFTEVKYLNWLRNNDPLNLKGFLKIWENFAGIFPIFHTTYPNFDLKLQNFHKFGEKTALFSWIFMCYRILLWQSITLQICGIFGNQI